MHELLTEKHIEAYARDGAVFVKGLFAEHVDDIKKGIALNMSNPSEYAAENLKPGEAGRFFDDYCNWNRILPFQDVITHSPVGEVASDLMQSRNVQLFHDHVLVKEAGTGKSTPWHQDSPYYFVDGEQTVSFWCPVDPVDASTLRCVAGSHKWPRPVLPTRWLSEENFYPEADVFMPVPDPDKEGMLILEWPMEPGDAVAFDFRMLHGTRGNKTHKRRRAFSLRLIGDDTRYIERPGPTSPPFPEHGMKEGQRLREDWFPIIYRRPENS